MDSLSRSTDHRDRNLHSLSHRFQSSCSWVMQLGLLYFVFVLSSNIPSSPSYGVYISQLIRYARCCSYYNDLGYRHKILVDRLMSQGYEVKRLRNLFKKFYGRYPDLIGKYQRSVKDMAADSFPD